MIQTNENKEKHINFSTLLRQIECMNQITTLLESLKILTMFKLVI